MKMKLWEKIFIVLNIVVIIGIISFYAYRAVKYYKITNVIVEQSKLIDILDKTIYIFSINKEESLNKYNELNDYKKEIFKRLKTYNLKEL